MTNKMTPQEWLNKAMWEGGLADGFEYGLRSSDIDNSDQEFKERIHAAEVAYYNYEQRENEFFDYAADNDYEWE